MGADQNLQPLGALEVKRLTGDEPLLHSGKELPLTLRDFWQWSVSDLVSNLTRGRLAEFIVAHALGIDVEHGVRREWDSFDLITGDGIKVEVKASAYVQSWHQTKHSAVAWTVGPTRKWDYATNVWSSDASWQADVYVLALFEPKEKGADLNPLDVDRWCFFVLPVALLRERTRKCVLTFKDVGESCRFDGLAEAVRKAASS